MANRIRTKYDRMFERKDQNILSERYTKLVDHSALGNDDGDDFITLKRADHGLDEDQLPASEQISERKLKMATSKRAMLKFKGAPTRIVFDDEGNPHEAYDMKHVEDVFGEGERAALEAGKKFVESERRKLANADWRDKEEVREKRTEMKRKRKNRERGSDFDDSGNEGPTVAGGVDDGYIPPDFGYLSPSDGEQSDAVPPPPKQNKKMKGQSRGRKDSVTLKDKEALALRMLRSGQ